MVITKKGGRFTASVTYKGKALSASAPVKHIARLALLVKMHEQ